MQIQKFILLITILLGGCSSFLRSSLRADTPQPLVTPTFLTNAETSATSPATHHLTTAFKQFCWITYTPSTFDPTVTPRHWPTPAEVEADLHTLHQFGVRGLITYRTIFLDRSQEKASIDLPKLAQAEGFEGLIVGVWNPQSQEELKAAQTWETSPLVLGYVVGNEGLGQRYTWETLQGAVTQLRTATQKPVTTTERLADYFRDDRLRTLGDWIFPNAHPYFARMKEPYGAVGWTKTAFENLQRLSDRPVIFKEVGLPTAGDPAVSEATQETYYQNLRQTAVPFAFFTAFDLPWKRSTAQANLGANLNPEPYWGLFHTDRTPKKAADVLQKSCIQR